MILELFTWLLIAFGAGGFCGFTLAGYLFFRAAPPGDGTGEG